MQCIFARHIDPHMLVCANVSVLVNRLGFRILTKVGKSKWVVQSAGLRLVWLVKDM